MYQNAEMDYFYSLDNGLNWVCMCNVYLSRLTTGNITVENYEYQYKFPDLYTQDKMNWFTKTIVLMTTTWHERAFRINDNLGRGSVGSLHKGQQYCRSVFSLLSV